MAKVHLRALDQLLAAALLVQKGKHKEAAKRLMAAVEEEDFDNTVTTLDSANEEGWDDGEEEVDLDDVEDIVEEDDEAELAKALASASATGRTRRKVQAADEVEDKVEDEDNADWEDDAETATLRDKHLARRAANLKALQR